MPTTATSDALARARSLLLPDAAERAGAGTDGGYLDLLASEVPSTGPAQDLMTTSLVPRIYERWWRPALGRVAKGITGPGMDEEARIARLLMALSHGDAVLDLACGTGNFSRKLARAVTDTGVVIGVDTTASTPRAASRHCTCSRSRSPRSPS